MVLKKIVALDDNNNQETKQKPRAQTPALGVSGRLQLKGWGTRVLWAHCRERDAHR